MMQLLTNSRIKSYRACPRQHRNSYTLGYSPIREAPALAFGTATHSCLQAYWEARRVSSPMSPFDRAIAAIPANMDPFARARLEAMLVAYTASWDNERVEVIFEEREFRLPLINPDTGHPSKTFELAGKIDLMLRLEDGRVAIVEHKTRSGDAAAGSDYRDALVLDGQITQYFLGAESLGYAPDVCIYDVLLKPNTRPALATPHEVRRYTKTGALYASQRERDETVDEYRDRLLADVSSGPSKYVQTFEVARLDDERDEYNGDIWDIAAEIRASERTGRSRRNPDSCHRYGSPCSYLPVCQRRASLEDTTLYKLTVQHPELATKEGDAA